MYTLDSYLLQAPQKIETHIPAQMVVNHNFLCAGYMCTLSVKVTHALIIYIYIYTYIQTNKRDNDFVCSTY